MKNKTRREKIRQYRELKLIFVRTILKGEPEINIANKILALRKEINEILEPSPYRVKLYWYWNGVSFVGVNEIYRIGRSK